MQNKQTNIMKNIETILIHKITGKTFTKVQNRGKLIEVRECYRNGIAKEYPHPIVEGFMIEKHHFINPSKLH